MAVKYNMSAGNRTGFSGRANRYCLFRKDLSYFQLRVCLFVGVCMCACSCVWSPVSLELEFHCELPDVGAGY